MSVATGRVLIVFGNDAEGIARPQFAAGFMDHHAGSIVHDPYIAVVELVANCWDAGATRVEIAWPTDAGGEIAFDDDGIGMTNEEFRHRWLTLNYDRLSEQGRFVDSLTGRRTKRRAFGRNGIGRHAPFCFSDRYAVVTRKSGNDPVAYLVRRSDGDTPFSLAPLSDTRDSAGTTIRIQTDDRQISLEEVRNLLGTRFAASPEFRIALNGKPIELQDLSRFTHELTAITQNHSYRILRFDYGRASRTADLHGVAFWTNGRLVGNPDWRVGTTTLLDARTATAKQTTYVVVGDNLVESTKPDWSGYHADAEVVGMEKAVIAAVRADLHRLTGEERKRKKISALRQSKAEISRLPIVAQERVATFIDQLQQEAPSLTATDLDHAVHVLATLEESSSGFSLLRRLAELGPDDVDTLDRLLKDWTVRDLAVVADELRYRLELIARLEDFVSSARVDEVHELLPLFERGLWMFGPEFEAIDFLSNRALTTIVRNLLGSKSSQDSVRPDLVAAEAFTCESFDDTHEADGFAQVLVVELKRIPHTVAPEDKDQAMGYARKIRTAPSVGKHTKIACWVLGSSMDSEADEVIREGAIEVKPITYSTLLQRAHARTFHLLQRLEAELDLGRDAELTAVLEEGTDQSLDLGD
jgi:hypothetical protein